MTPKTYTAIVKYASGTIYMAGGFATLTAASDALETFTADLLPSMIIRSYVMPTYGSFTALTEV